MNTPVRITDAIKKILVVLILGLTFGAVHTYAQSKDWAVGLRLGEPAGLNVKKYFGAGNALDVTLGSSGAFYGGTSRAYRYKGYNGYRQAGIALVANYEWQKPLKGAKGIQWYIGLGGAISSRRFYYSDREYYSKNGKVYYYGDYYYENQLAIGATGILGLEWFIPNSPISLNADLGLYMELFPATAWFNAPVGIGGRYNF
ncbi:hypothetical protein GXP67_10140 [Rhodocytophaga rosea]|uniref:DUF3575 domain-containing protein n=1 Tax=Rhodocytophaga rosea TaxID=2704465 RepID=A0A6C0GGY2_9BACT|nr:hypothetical protein [Rhodocytophaga rosea]QHT66982.1 hypothetical protein GXP67_10140 [Rhodocytophaga rosea]